MDFPVKCSKNTLPWFYSSTGKYPASRVCSHVRGALCEKDFVVFVEYQPTNRNPHGCQGVSAEIKVLFYSAEFKLRTSVTMRECQIIAEILLFRDHFGLLCTRDSSVECCFFSENSNVSIIFIVKHADLDIIRLDG